MSIEAENVRLHSRIIEMGEELERLREAARSPQGEEADEFDGAGCSPEEDGYLRLREASRGTEPDTAKLAEALREVKRVTGTSTEAWHIAHDALAAFGDETPDATP